MLKMEENLEDAVRQIKFMINRKVKEMHKLMGGYVPSKATKITQLAQDIKEQSEIILEEKIKAIEKMKEAIENLDEDEMEEINKMASEQDYYNEGYDQAIHEVRELCDDLCYCKCGEGTMYSETKYGMMVCAFCWLKHRMKEEEIAKKTGSEVKK